MTRLSLFALFATLFVTGACAGGGGGGGASPSTASLPGGQSIAQGERPRQTAATREAERALQRAEDTDDSAEAQMHFEAALASAMLAIEEDEMNPLGHRQAALAALGLERYAEAGGHFDRATELRPLYGFEDRQLREQVWIDLFNQAIETINAADYATAAEELENAHAVYKMRPEVMFTLTQIYGPIGEHDLALERMAEGEAFMMAPEVADADSATQVDWMSRAEEMPLMRAQILTDAQRFNEASDAYRTLVEADPSNIEAALNLAGILIEMGSGQVGEMSELEQSAAMDEAFQRYRGLMESGLELEALHYYRMGVGFYNGDDAPAAAAAFGTTVEMSPFDRDAVEMWTRSLADDSSHAEVVAAADHWLTLDPNSETAMLLKAQAQNQLETEDDLQITIEMMEALPFEVRNLRIQRYQDGGGVLTGSAANNELLEPGSVVTLVFTFYGEDGNPVGEVSQSVTLQDPGAQQLFRVEFTSDQMVAGYGYTVGG